MQPQDVTQLTPDQLHYAAIVGSWWFGLVRKAFVTWIAYEYTLWQSRRLDRRARGRDAAPKSFGQILDEIRAAPSAGLGIYYGLREFARGLLLAAIVCFA